MSGTTTLSASTLGTTSSTSVVGSSVGVGAGAGSGLCLSTPTSATYSTLALSSGVKTAAFAAGTFLFASAAFVGIALLSYAITKAAMES